LTKIEHSLADKTRVLDELQQRAERFQQFVRNMHKEMVSQGQHLMQMNVEFNRGIGGGPSASPTGVSTSAGAHFAEQVNRASGRAAATENPRNMAETILLSERIRHRNAGRAGVSALADSPFVDPVAIRAATLSVTSANLDNAVSQQPHSHSGISSNPEHRRRRAMAEEYSNRGALKNRLLEKYPQMQELNDPLAGRALLSGSDRRRAEAMAMTGGASHFRYDITDVPATMQLAQKFEKDKGDLHRRIEDLRRGGDGANGGTNRTIATALEGVVRRMDVSQNRFAEAVSNFNRLSGDPKVKEDSREFKTALNELRHSIESLTESNQDLKRTSKAAGELGGGGGAGGAGGTLYERMRPFVPFASAAFGAAAAVGGMIMRGGLAMDQAAIGAERRGADARGAIGARIAAREMEAHDMTKPENLLRYRADLMFGGRYNYIGSRPTSLMSAATQEIQDGINISRQQLYLGAAGAAGNAIVGGAKMVGGAAMLGGGPLGMGMGVGMIGSGAQEIAGAVGQGVDAAASNRYLALTQGGLEGGVLGSIWRGRSETDSRARFLQGAARAETAKDLLGVIDNLQSSEIRERHSRDLTVMEERQRMADVQQQGAVLVGRYAVSREAFMDEMYGGGTSPARAAVISRGNAMAAKYPTGEGVADAVASGRRGLRRQFVAANISRNSPLNQIAGLFGFGDSDVLARQEADLASRIRGSRPGSTDYSGLVESAEALANPSLYHPLGGKGYVTSGFGSRHAPTHGASSFHNGMDFGTGGRSLPIYASGAGSVIGRGFDPRNGNYLRIRGNDGLVFGYAHMAKMSSLGVGDPVSRAQQIGMVGNTGVSTGMHLHWTVKQGGVAVDPSGMIDMGKTATAEQPPTRAAFETMTGRLGLAPSDFMSHMNAVTNVLGGGSSSMSQTQRMILLGRSGLGNFESLLGNVASINRVSGGANNLGQLEAVLGAAVAAGFDKSRTAQMFVQTGVELAKSLNLTNVGGASGMLSRAAAFMSPSGIADERSLAQAAQGIQTYGQFTAQRGGLMGALRSAAVFGAGGSIGGGAAILSGISVPEASEMMAQIDGGGLPANPKLKRLMTLQGSAATRNQLSALVGGSNQIFQSLYSAFGGGNFSTTMSAMAKAKADGNSGQLKKLQEEMLARGHTVGELQGLGGAAGEAWVMQEMSSAGIVSAEVSKESIEAAVRGGNALYDDPAKKNIRKYLDNLMMDFRGNTRGYSLPEYEKFVASGGGYATIGSGELAGQSILPSRMREAMKSGQDQQYLSAAQKELSQLDTFELVRGAEIRSAQMEGDVQSVRVTNATEIAMYLAEFQRVGSSTGRKQNHNK